MLIQIYSECTVDSVGIVDEFCVIQRCLLNENTILELVVVPTNTVLVHGVTYIVRQLYKLSDIDNRRVRSMVDL